MGGKRRVARVAKLTPGFLRRLRGAGVVRGTARSGAVGATVAALTAADVLPGPQDARGTIHPSLSVYVRRVTGWNLWLWYKRAGDHVVLLSVTPEPPAVVEA